MSDKLIKVEMARGIYYQKTIDENGEAVLIKRKKGDVFEVTKEQFEKIKPKLKESVIVSEGGGLSKKEVDVIVEKAVKKALKGTITKEDHDTAVKEAVNKAIDELAETPKKA